MKKTLDELIELREEVKQELVELTAEHRDLVNLICQTCPHDKDSIIEGEYSQGKYFASLAPFRVCKKCGYAEEGWGSWYRRLGPDVYSGIPLYKRDEARKHVKLWLKGEEKHEMVVQGTYYDFEEQIWKIGRLEKLHGQ